MREARRLLSDSGLSRRAILCVSTGTEDWLNSAWYFNGWRDFDAGVHSYVGTDQPAAPNGSTSSAWPPTSWSKWGGVPFTSSAGP